MASTDARPVPKKNTAFRLYFDIRKNDGTLITTWAGMDTELSQDGGTFADATNEATEIGTSGCGYIDLTASEMNNDAVIVKVTVTNTDALPFVVVLFPEEAGDIRTDTTYWNGSAVATPDTAGVPHINVVAINDQAATASAGVDFDDLDSILTNTTNIEGDTNELQADWTNGGRLDLILDELTTNIDAIETDTQDLQTQIGTAGDGLTAIPWNAAWDAEVQSECNDALVALGLDHLVSTSVTGTDIADNSIIAYMVSKSATADWDSYVNTTDALEAISDSGGGDATAANQSTIITHLTDIKGATWSSSTDTLEAIRDRGDAAWVTGGGGSITDILDVYPLIPTSIDLADTTTWRIGLQLRNALDDLPTTAEITPGTISIDRKAIGATSWSAIVTDAACSESDGLIYYDEVFDSGEGYAEGDSLRITFKSQKVTVAANDYEITGSGGVIFYTEIRQDVGGIKGSGWSSSTDTLEAMAADIQDLQTQLGTAGAGLTAIPWNASWDAEVQSEVIDALQETVPDSIHADGTRPNIQSGIYLLCQFLTDFTISGTTYTVKKVDGSTTLATLTLNDGSEPTGITRTT